ncbi:hypothetical protein BJX96DRAFT_150708 [Aspergillus floccosus]
MSSPKKPLNRPKKRTLVRWDGMSFSSTSRLTLRAYHANMLIIVDNLDELLLLTIQSVCNKNSVKIPWAEVAKTMGHNVTEGAIVQHLAKLRSRRVASDKAVPPPLRRGGVGSSSTKSSETKRKRHNTLPLGPDEENPDVIPVIDHSSDEDYGVRIDTKARRKRKQRTTIQPLKDVPIKAEPDTEDNTESEEENSGEYLVPGAPFLDFPNDRQAVESPPVSESKIVVLKYRGRNDHSPPGVQEDLRQTPVNLYMDQTLDSGLYQHSLSPLRNSPANRGSLIWDSICARHSP